jgi:hypothetical protein
MPVDKLILLSSRLAPHFRSLAANEGKPGKMYRSVVNLDNTDAKLPAILHCGGQLNGINKLDFVDVAYLGMTRVEAIANEVFGSSKKIKIYRIDFCIDVPGVTIWQFAEIVRVENAQSSASFRNRYGTSLYLQFSHEQKILLYERLKYMKHKKDSSARLYADNEDLVRFEVQLTGRGVPFPDFCDIRRHQDIDLLENVTFRRLHAISKGLSPMKLLAAERLQDLIGEHGLQLVSKRFLPPVWAAINKSYFVENGEPSSSALRESLRRGVNDWFNDVIRFPRAA